MKGKRLLRNVLLAVFIICLMTQYSYATAPTGYSQDSSTSSNYMYQQYDTDTLKTNAPDAGIHTPFPTLTVICSLLVFSLVAFVAIITFRKSKTNSGITKAKERGISLIASLLAVIASIIGGASYTTNQITSIYNSLSVNVASKNESNAIASNVNILSLKEMTMNEILLNAQASLDAGQYDRAFELYLRDNPDLVNNPIRNNNIAVMYENGLFVAKDIDVAATYYDKAISAGNENAFCNKLAMLLMNPDYTSDAINLIIHGHDENIQELNNYWTNVEKYLLEKDISFPTFNDFCTLLSTNEQRTTVQSLFTTQSVGTTTSYNTVLYDTPSVKYHLESINHFLSSDSEGNAVVKTVRVYDVISHDFIGRSILQKGFLRLD